MNYYKSAADKLRDAARRESTSTNPFFKADQPYVKEKYDSFSSDDVEGFRKERYIPRKKVAMFKHPNTTEFFFSLSNASRNLMNYLSFEIEDYHETVTLVGKEVARITKMNRNYVSQAIKELVELNVLKPYKKSVYYFNPHYFFSGNYYKYRQRYHKDSMFKINSSEIIEETD